MPDITVEHVLQSSAQYNTRFHYRKTALLFAVQFTLFFAESIYNIATGHFSLKEDTIGKIEKIILEALALQTGTVILVSLFLSLVVFQTMKRYPTAVIHGASIWVVIMLLAYSGLQLYLESYFSAIIACVLSWVVCYIHATSRRAFEMSSSILGLVARCAHNFRSMYYVLFLSIFVGHIYATLANLSIVGLMARASKMPSIVVAIFGLYLAFSIWWSAQVIANLVRLVVAGIYSQYYFGGASHQRFPVFEYLRKGLVCSLGSICYASVLVGPINTIYGATYPIFSKISILSLPYKLVSKLYSNFNYLAFNQVALYNDPYRKAANQSFKIFEDSGIHGILIDSYVGTTIFFTSVSIAMTSAFVHILVNIFYFHGEAPKYISGFIGSSTLGYIIPGLMFKIVDAGTLATIVCMANDLEGLRRTSPELCELVQQKYPVLRFEESSPSPHIIL